MREYDGIEVRYRRPDTNLAKSLQVIENLLGFAPEPQQLDFDLSFWAGGAGYWINWRSLASSRPSSGKFYNKNWIYILPKRLLHGTIGVMTLSG